MKELCEDSTLKNLVIMIHRWSEATDITEERLQSDLSNPSGFVQTVVRRGAKIYHCTGASETDLGALRIILGGRSVVPEVQQEPIDKGSKSEQTAVRPVEPSKEKPELEERHNSDIRELGGNTEEAADKEIEELRRELEEQKRRAQEADVFKKRIAEMVREHYQELEEQKRRGQEEADVFKKHAAEMQSEKEESIRQEASQELEEQKRQAQEEADELRKYITELQSKLEEDRHASGKVSVTYNFRHVPARSGVFLVGPLAHLALQRVYPSTDLRPNSLIGSTRHFTDRSMSDGCKTFRKVTWPGSSTIWIRHVTTSPFLTRCSSWPVGSRQS